MAQASPVRKLLSLSDAGLVASLSASAVVTLKKVRSKKEKAGLDFDLAGSIQVRPEKQVATSSDYWPAVEVAAAG
jgi:hypothetical protein